MADLPSNPVTISSHTVTLWGLHMRERLCYLWRPSIADSHFSIEQHHYLNSILPNDIYPGILLFHFYPPLISSYFFVWAEIIAVRSSQAVWVSGCRKDNRNVSAACYVQFHLCTGIKQLMIAALIKISSKHIIISEMWRLCFGNSCLSGNRRM